MIPKLPSPSPDVASTNAKRQARPLAHADAAKPKKRSSRCVSGSVQCKWSTWKRLTKSDGPMLMDWWTLPVAMHWHAPMLRTLLSSTSHQEEKDWRVGRKTVYSTIAQHTEMGNATIQSDVASFIMVIMSSDHMSCGNMSKLHETTIGSCNDKKDTSKHIETIHACSDFPCWFPKLWNAMNLASFVHTPWMKYMVFKFQQKSDHSLQSFQKKDAT